MTEVVLPELGCRRVVLSVWFSKAGERVYAGDRLVEVLVDGATFDVAAPATGRLAAKLAWPEQPLTTGQVLGLVEEE